MSFTFVILGALGDEIGFAMDSKYFYLFQIPKYAYYSQLSNLI